METIPVIIILFVVVALFGGVGLIFTREAGANNAAESARRFLSTSRQAGRSLVATRTNATSTIPGTTGDAESSESTRDEGSAPVTTIKPARRSTMASPGSTSESAVAVAIDDTALRELREEMQGELRRASGITREFDARLTRIEANSVDTPRLSAEMTRSIEEHADAQRQELARLRDELESVRQTAGPRGERRTEALANLYGHLARVESALAGVVNPMLLPGEPLTLPAELPPETMIWDNWSEVGERAYALGDAFNQHRLVLDPETADEIEGFIAILRRGLTGSVDPNVRTQQPTPIQLQQMRAGLETIVAALPGVRRRVELAYRGESGADGTGSPAA
ncbi:MAG: hypothetical protein AVDCRST_MAG87-1578 [uncultured Thermomicrobiales bacterium]|uniref:Uncharacterized protein n=1 Tax=uncultured Thermomicrobiales bacterium TaxID=1645740 RepID=A0A6J4UXQ3_9BACT|nr:MAG: hypothetical protein AVDCRST_MAG87-1578 [uncultured Thermomicrobiales bacterium]